MCVLLCHVYSCGIVKQLHLSSDCQDLMALGWYQPHLEQATALFIRRDSSYKAMCVHVCYKTKPYLPCLPSSLLTICVIGKLIQLIAVVSGSSLFNTLSSNTFYFFSTSSLTQDSWRSNLKRSQVTNHLPLLLEPLSGWLQVSIKIKLNRWHGFCAKQDGCTVMGSGATVFRTSCKFLNSFVMCQDSSADSVSHPNIMLWSY